MSLKAKTESLLTDGFEVLQLSLQRRRYLIILGIDISFCLKLYGLIEYLNTMLLKFLILSLFMDRKNCFACGNKPKCCHVCQAERSSRLGLL